MKLWCLDSKEKIEWDILELKVNKCEYRPLCAGCEQLTDSEDEVEESISYCDLNSAFSLYEIIGGYSTPASIDISTECKYINKKKYWNICTYGCHCDFQREE